MSNCPPQQVALIVDDDMASRLLTRETLEASGFLVHEAGDGHDGLVAFQELRPDIVLLDVCMPNLDGFGACKALRQLDGGDHVPILMMTGLDDSESINHAYEVGATDFITKPIVWPLLCHRIRYLLRASRAMVDLAQSKIGLAKANAQLQVDAENEKAAARRIEYLAYHDGLTGLPNRTMFGKVLEQHLKEAQRYNKKLALLFVDLDRFKNINDTLGHAAGDILLQEVAQRLKTSMRASDVVARLGGDEFVVMLPELTDKKAIVAFAEKMLLALGKSFTVIGQEFRITASIGITLYPQDGGDESSLMKNADIAMYQAKEAGRNGFAFYSEQLNRHSFEILAMESSLRRALELNQFVLHYQPKVDLATNTVTGVEALLRWNHPDLGMVSPINFISIAEETGLIVPIGKWVLRNACLQGVAWKKAGLPPLVMAVNLSARQFADDDLLADVMMVLRDTQMEPTLLELEITESMLMQNPEKTVATLTALKGAGIRLSVDDFGTGYSSLSNLKRFPVDTVKIDGSFVRDLAHCKDDRGIAEAIIRMGKTLGLTVIAEGVETADQKAFLRAHGCDEFQGFHFSKAITAHEFEGLLTSHRKDESLRLA